MMMQEKDRILVPIDRQLWEEFKEMIKDLKADGKLPYYASRTSQLRLLVATYIIDMKGRIAKDNLKVYDKTDEEMERGIIE